MSTEAIRPNILLVMVDELAPQATPVYGHPVVQAPNMQRLARKGVVFDNAYTNSPLCAPARASLLAGRLTPAIAAWDNASEFAASTPDAASLSAPFRLSHDTVRQDALHRPGPVARLREPSDH